MIVFNGLDERNVTKQMQWELQLKNAEERV